MFILGLITGLVIAAINIILFERFRIPIERTMPLIEAKMHNVMGKEGAYISGLSEEESNFMEAIKSNEVEII